MNGMASQINKKVKSCSIFDLPARYFESASLAGFHHHTAPQTQIEPTGNEDNKEENQITGIDMNMNMNRWSCNTCCQEFSSLEEQRSHFKSDFHRFNVKWRMSGREPINEEEFEEVAQGRFLKEGDVSSISGSDDESDESSCAGRYRSESVKEVTNIKTQISISLQSGEVALVSRSLLLGDREDVVLEDTSSTVNDDNGKGLCLTDGQLVRRVQSLVQESRGQKNFRVVLLASGGHFAGCVYDGKNIVVHKTYHRYVVRAKAGGKQSTKDSTGKAPKSGGASLRRYNEMALKKEILELLVAWKCYLDSALCIYIYAPSSNGQMFFGGENPPFSYHDTRVRRIPFTTRRPTLKEVNRIYNQLTFVQFVENMEYNPPDQQAEIATNTEMEKTDLKVINEIKAKNENEIEMSSTLGVSSQLQHMDHLCISDDTITGKQSTLLHEAAKSDNLSRILELLEQDNNPCIKDERGRTPYLLATDKETRNVFRRFMAANPDKWDWHAANVPSPLTEEMEASQAAKKAEKDAKRKARAKELAKLRKVKEKEKAKSISEEAACAVVRHGQEVVSHLLQKGKPLPSMNSPAFQEDIKKAQAIEREKRAAAAEKRLSAPASSSGNNATAPPYKARSMDTSSDIHCSCCAASLAGKIPFHRYNYKYCSTSCMHVHKEMLEDE